MTTLPGRRESVSSCDGALYDDSASDTASHTHQIAAAAEHSLDFPLQLSPSGRRPPARHSPRQRSDASRRRAQNAIGSNGGISTNLISAAPADPSSPFISHDGALATLLGSNRQSARESAAMDESEGRSCREGVSAVIRGNRWSAIDAPNTDEALDPAAAELGRWASTGLQPRSVDTPHHPQSPIRDSTEPGND